MYRPPISPGAGATSTAADSGSPACRAREEMAASAARDDAARADSGARGEQRSAKHAELEESEGTATGAAGTPVAALGCRGFVASASAPYLCALDRPDACTCSAPCTPDSGPEPLVSGDLLFSASARSS